VRHPPHGVWGNRGNVGLKSISASPVFVVGSPRSGTTALAAALHQVGYHGFHEGNFVGLIDHFDRITDNYYRSFGSDDPLVMMSKIDKEVFKNQVHHVFKRMVDRLNPVAPWFDKSCNPGVIRRIPVLLKLWPTAHFIFAKRRGIENVMSRMKKFPHHNFEYHCKDWAANMSAWRAVCQAIPNLTAIEIDQQDMILTPDPVAGQLAAFLAISPHLQMRMADTFHAERPQRTAVGTAERVLSLRAAGWPQAEIDIFLRHCGEEMDLFGYTMDEQYRQPHPPLRKAV
jgi:hypothetical protein